MLNYIAQKLCEYAKDSNHYEFMDCLDGSEEDFYEQMLSLLRSEEGVSLDGLIDCLITDIEEDNPEKNAAIILLALIRRYCSITVGAYFKISNLDWKGVALAINKKQLAEKMQDVFEIVYESNQPFATRDENIRSVLGSMEDLNYFTRALTDINDFLDKKTLSDSERDVFGYALGGMLVMHSYLKQQSIPRLMKVSQKDWDAICSDYKGTWQDYYGEHPEWIGKKTVMSTCITHNPNEACVLLIEGVHFVVEG